MVHFNQIDQLHSSKEQTIVPDTCDENTNIVVYSLLFNQLFIRTYMKYTNPDHLYEPLT